jgi:hypothetical protein
MVLDQENVKKLYSYIPQVSTNPWFQTMILHEVIVSNQVSYFKTITLSSNTLFQTFQGRRQDFEGGLFSPKSRIFTINFKDVVSVLRIFTVNFKDFSQKGVVRIPPTPWRRPCAYY